MGAETYPQLRMLVIVLLAMSVGSVYAYSAWSAKLASRFVDWTAEDLSLVYSFGIIGAHATPIGGLLYDNFGAVRTYSAGLSMVIAGFVGMTLCTQSSASSWAFSLCYYIEEQGASTLYMACFCDVLMHFPRESIGVSISLFSSAFGMSALFWSTMLALVELSLEGIFLSIGGLIVVFTIPQYFLGVASGKALSAKAAPSCQDYVEAASCRHFVFLVLLSGMLHAPFVMILGTLKPLGIASQTSGALLANATFLTGCAARFSIGRIYDLQQRAGKASLMHVFFVCSLLDTLGFSFLYAGASMTEVSFAGMGPGLVWCGCLCSALSVSGTSPLVGIFVKERFPSAVSGSVTGLKQLIVAIANMVLSGFVGPKATSKPSDFERSFRASLLLVVIFAFAAGSWEGTCRPGKVIIPLVMFAMATWGAVAAVITLSGDDIVNTMVMI